MVSTPTALRRLEAEAHGALPATVEDHRARAILLTFEMAARTVRNSAGKIGTHIDGGDGG
jgi:hypothetical protein